MVLSTLDCCSILLYESGSVVVSIYTEVSECTILTLEYYGGCLSGGATENLFRSVSFCHIHSVRSWSDVSVQYLRKNVKNKPKCTKKKMKNMYCTSSSIVFQVQFHVLSVVWTDIWKWAEMAVKCLLFSIDTNEYSRGAEYNQQ